MSTADQAEVINQAIADPVPEMPSPLETTVELLRGVYDAANDVWHTVAEVRELNGEDEEYLAALEKKSGLTYTEYMTALLRRATVRIGNLSTDVNPHAVDKLILGDRDLLFLAIVRATYGTTRDIRVRCPVCAESNDVQIDLDEDFPIIRPDFDVKKPLEVQTSQGVVRLRLPNGEDTEIVSKKGSTDAEINTILVSRCAVWGDNAPADPVVWAKKLSIADRKKLVRAISEVEIGPKLGEVDTHCAHCEADMPIALDWVSLLFG